MSALDAANRLEADAGMADSTFVPRPPQRSRGSAFAGVRQSAQDDDNVSVGSSQQGSQATTASIAPDLFNLASFERKVQVLTDLQSNAPRVPAAKHPGRFTKANSVVIPQHLRGDGQEKALTQAEIAEKANEAKMAKAQGKNRVKKLADAKYKRDNGVGISKEDQRLLVEDHVETMSQLKVKLVTFDSMKPVTIDFLAKGVTVNQEKSIVFPRKILYGVDFDNGFQLTEWSTHSAVFEVTGPRLETPFHLGVSYSEEMYVYFKLKNEMNKKNDFAKMSSAATAMFGGKAGNLATQEKNEKVELEFLMSVALQQYYEVAFVKTIAARLQVPSQRLRLLSGKGGTYSAYIEILDSIAYKDCSYDIAKSALDISRSGNMNFERFPITSLKMHLVFGGLAGVDDSSGGSKQKPTEKKIMGPQEAAILIQRTFRARQLTVNPKMHFPSAKAGGFSRLQKSAPGTGTTLMEALEKLIEEDLKQEMSSMYTRKRKDRRHRENMVVARVRKPGVVNGKMQPWAVNVAKPSEPK